MQEHPLT
ncbi:Protein of unknown function [Gryllus bimaculatus]|nr:Protein of unknown function [Gryllus bimaculatus]